MCCCCLFVYWLFNINIIIVVVVVVVIVIVVVCQRVEGGCSINIIIINVLPLTDFINLKKKRYHGMVVRA